MGIKGITNILLPKEVWSQNNIRDLRFFMTEGLPPKIEAPHITLLDPFVSSDRFEQATEKFRQALADFSPFVVTLRELRYFTHKRRGHTLYLKPEVAKNEHGHNPLHQLQKTLYEACAGMEFLETRTKPEQFSPHVSLGKISGKKRLDKILEQQKSWQPISFEVTEVYIMSKLLHDTEIRRIIPLGKSNAPVRFTPVPFPEGNQASVNINHVPPGTKQEELLAAFEHFNAIKAAVAFKTLAKTKRVKGWGHVVFDNQEQRDKALAQKITLRGKLLDLFPCD